MSGAPLLLCFISLHLHDKTLRVQQHHQNTRAHSQSKMGSLPHIVEDLEGVVQLYSDGSVFRANDVDFNIPIHDDSSIVWRDCQFDNQNHLYLRLYKPVNASTKLPVVYFFHGGGFCVGSRAWPNNHNACLRLASGLQALVVAPDYRLAPEHRLPAAVDDALTSLKWLQARATADGPPAQDTWLHDQAVDFDRVYIMGDSSGGNMAHHLAVQLGPGSPELAPVRIRGYVLMAPFFGGSVRTKSEAEGMPEPILNVEILDRFWRLSLPPGKNADHPLANPFSPFSKNNVESVMFDPVLVIAGEIELLRDRVEDYARRLKEAGKKVEYVEFEGKYHGFFNNDPYSELGDRVLQEIKDWMSKISG
ncbi:strigolactones hydrolase CXE15 [Coffea arabica]|uniref:Strigolactones hydrolase CXE15 n=1 Tax=Coffea arabica TaxID=13443 RepID=A0A6P6SLM8_COFAR